MLLDVYLQCNVIVFLKVTNKKNTINSIRLKALVQHLPRRPVLELIAFCLRKSPEAGFHQYLAARLLSVVCFPQT